MGAAATTAATTLRRGLEQHWHYRADECGSRKASGGHRIEDWRPRHRGILQEGPQRGSKVQPAHVTPHEPRRGRESAPAVRTKLALAVPLQPRRASHSWLQDGYSCANA